MKTLVFVLCMSLASPVGAFAGEKHGNKSCGKRHSNVYKKYPRHHGHDYHTHNYHNHPHHESVTEDLVGVSVVGLLVSAVTMAATALKTEATDETVCVRVPKTEGMNLIGYEDVCGTRR